MTAPPRETTQLTTRIAYENRWLRLREDIVRHPDGSEGIYGVVERPDFAVVVPWQDGCVTMVEQYRYPIGRRLLELPMGTCETLPGMTAAITAATELEQETGLLADTMTFIASLFQGPGYCTQVGHVFLATGLSQGVVAREATEHTMTCRAIPLPELEALIQAGDLQDATSLAALGLLRLRGLL